MTYAELLQFVIENGRVSTDEETGKFDVESLKVEIEFEANERGMDEVEAVAFALSHTDHN